MLSFYRSTSRDFSSEKSHYYVINEQYKTEGQFSEGDRSRIHEIHNSDEVLITMLYQRASRKIEFKSIYGKDIKTTFAYNDEPAIPTDLEPKNNKLIFCGNQNGFSYPDGHDYKEKSAFGFIGEIDSDGKITNQKKHQHHQHLFYEDIEVVGRSAIVTGTKQQDGSSMDLLLVNYNDSLSIEQEKTFTKEGVQYGLKTIKYNDFYYTLIASENLENNKLNLSMMKSDLHFNSLWEKNFDSHQSHDPKDLIITNDKIYCLINTREEKGAATNAELYVLSLDGILLNKKSIQ